ncbi:MAG TPA: molybdenum cofactor guanylyltransferase [Syntrophomonadaceae bacterium]|nr:molybdenum cofactor guanylyltransferase [Syntrophomonadaceae bacterium]
MQATGIIMAGGRSTRMRMNKAFVKIKGETILNHMIKKMSPLFAELIIISNDPHLFEHTGLPVYKDLYSRMGPVAGVHSALYHASYNEVFILGCDMPFIPAELIKYMVNRLEGYDTVVPLIDSHLQPLAAAYHRQALPVFEYNLENQRFKLVRIFEELHALRLTEEVIQPFGKVEEIFFNVNDLEALKAANQIAGRYL